MKQAQIQKNYELIKLLSIPPNVVKKLDYTYFNQEKYQPQAISIIQQLKVNPYYIYQKQQKQFSELENLLFLDGIHKSIITTQQQIQQRFLLGEKKDKLRFFPTFVAGQLIKFFDDQMHHVIVSQQGVGKSFTVAYLIFLYQIAFRKHQRIIYIRDPQYFNKASIDWALDEFTHNFYEEIAENSKLQLEISANILEENTVEKQIHFSNLCNILKSVTKKNQLEVKLVIDQQNQLQHLIENKKLTETSNKTLENLMKIGSPNREYYISSYTNQLIHNYKSQFVKLSQIQYMDSTEQQQALKEFINFQFDNKLSPQQQKDVVYITGGNFLQINKLREDHWNGEHNALNIQMYTQKAIQLIINQLKIFLEGSEIQDSQLRERESKTRAQTMMQFLMAHKSGSSMNDYFSALDGRYFYLEGNDNKTVVREPLALESLQILLFKDQTQLIRTVISMFPENKSAMGILLEFQIKCLLPNLKLTIYSLQKQPKLQKQSKQLRNKIKQQQQQQQQEECIEMKSKQKYYTDIEAISSVENEVLYFPLDFREPLIDAFYITDKEIFIIQIKKRFSKKFFTELALINEDSKIYKQYQWFLNISKNSAGRRQIKFILVTQTQDKLSLEKWYDEVQQELSQKYDMKFYFTSADDILNENYISKDIINGLLK